MRFTRSELEMIYKYEATTKEDTVKAMRDEQSVARDDLTRIIIMLQINWKNFQNRNVAGS